MKNFKTNVRYCTENWREWDYLTFKNGDTVEHWNDLIAPQKVAYQKGLESLVKVLNKYDLRKHTNTGCSKYSSIEKEIVELFIPSDIEEKLEKRYKQLVRSNIATCKSQGLGKEHYFSVCQSWYAEAVGMFHSLQVLGFGDFGPINVPGNLSYLRWKWDREIEEELKK